MEVLAASKTSWNFVRKSTVSGDLHDLRFLCRSAKNFILQRVADWACEDQLSGKEHPIRQTTNDFYQVLNLPSLNSAISLDKAKILKSLDKAKILKILSLSKSLEEVSLCTRPCSTQGGSTSQ